MKRRRWQWSVVTAFLFGTQTAHAQPLRLTVDEAVARAKAANPGLSATRKDLDVADANLERSRALMPANPYFSTGAQHNSARTFDPNYAFYVSQEIEVAGQRKKRIEAATQGTERATWEVKDAELDLTANVKTAFLQALVGVDRVTVAQQSVDATAELTNQIGQRKRLSDLERVSFNVTVMQAARARRDLAAAERTRDNALGTLRFLLGLSLAQEIELAGAPKTEVQELPASPELLERALRQRADLVALRHSVQRAEVQLGLTKRESIPNIIVSGSVSRFQSDTLVGGDIGFPIPIFQRKTGEIHEAVADRERASLLVQNLERQIAKDVLEARRAYTVAAGDLQAEQRDIVPRSEENLDLERRLYERGDATQLEVIGAQIDLFTARREYLDALETYNTALIQLERATGSALETP